MRQPWKTRTKGTTKQKGKKFKLSGSGIKGSTKSKKIKVSPAKVEVKPFTKATLTPIGQSPNVRFKLGQTVTTKGINDYMQVNSEFAHYVEQCMFRHARGDWGDLEESDRKQNDWSLKNHGRLFSAYKGKGFPEIYIITEDDRSATTVLFPSEN